jgi:hypothetical protein
MKKIYELSRKCKKNKLSFTIDQESFDLIPFEIAQTHDKLSCKIINVDSEITALDWKIDFPNSSTTNIQYFAFACKNTDLFKIDLLEKSGGANLNRFKNKNIIFIGKLTNSSSNECKLEMFGIVDKYIDTVNCLKWGAFNSNDNNNSIGYLLAASSDGNGYIFLVEDILDKTNHAKKLRSINNIVCYEPEHKITLKRNTNTQQCIAGDWNQCGGANQVALGYSDGLINVFDIKDNNLVKKAIHAQSSNLKSYGSVDILKWCKTDIQKQIYTGTFQENDKKKKYSSSSLIIR